MPTNNFRFTVRSYIRSCDYSFTTYYCHAVFHTGTITWKQNSNSEYNCTRMICAKYLFMFIVELFLLLVYINKAVAWLFPSNIISLENLKRETEEEKDEDLNCSVRYHSCIQDSYVCAQNTRIFTCIAVSMYEWL